MALQEEWWGSIETRSVWWPPGPAQEVSLPSTEGTCWEVCLTQPKQPMGDGGPRFVTPNVETVMKTNGTRHIKSAP